MKSTLAPGLKATRRITVDASRAISFMGEEARVYATPHMVSDMEYTCRDALLPHLDAGEDSVGARVEIDHLGPTPLGAWVDFTVTLAEVKGRRVAFDFTARDAVEEVGRGRHVRFIVDTARTLERVRAKTKAR
jgi:fluoroacetyl-CoA thioesterase